MYQYREGRALLVLHVGHPSILGNPVRFPVSRSIPGAAPTGVSLFPRASPRFPRGGIAVNRIDRELLEFCRDDFRSLRDLRGRIPGGTLYRHASKLVRLGWLAKEGALYHSTSLGLRQLEERPDDGTWVGLEG